MVKKMQLLMFLMVLRFRKRWRKNRRNVPLIKWDPYTDIILARETGFVSLNDFVEGETYAVEAVEGGKKQMVVVEARDRKLSPHIEIIDKMGKS